MNIYFSGWSTTSAASQLSSPWLVCRRCSELTFIRTSKLWSRSLQNALLATYECCGHFDEVLSLLEAGLSLERAHVSVSLFITLHVAFALLDRWVCSWSCPPLILLCDANVHCVGHQSYQASTSLAGAHVLVHQIQRVCESHVISHDGLYLNEASRTMLLWWW